MTPSGAELRNLNVSQVVSKFRLASHSNTVVEIKHALVLLLLFELYSPATFLYVK